MQQKILTQGTEMFLKYGFKSVTMDDIANALGISKRTLYQYYPKKESLISACIHDCNLTLLETIEGLNSKQLNAVEENFEIHNIIKEMVGHGQINDSPIYQLKKYYPAIYKHFMEVEMNAFEGCVRENLNKGIQQGFYRADIDVEKTVLFYQSLISGIHAHSKSFEELQLSKHQALDYHTRAIATEKGLNELIKQLKINANDS